MTTLDLARPSLYDSPAVQAASGSAGRVEPICLANCISRTFMQPVLRTFGERMEVSMPQLPENPNFEHLKKQAKDLLRLYQATIRQRSSAFATRCPQPQE